MLILKSQFHTLIPYISFVCQEDQVESSKCMLNEKEEEYLIMVTGRDKQLRTHSGRLSKLKNEFDLLADRTEEVESELEIANATISEFKVNDHKGYSCIIYVTLIRFFCLLTTE